MRRVVAVGIGRVGGEHDPNARVVVMVQYDDGTYQVVGEERLSDNFSAWWKVGEETLAVGNSPEVAGALEHFRRVVSGGGD